MKPYILDASAFLAVVITKSLETGLPPEQVDDPVASLESEICPFSAMDAAKAARLGPANRAQGLCR